MELLYVVENKTSNYIVELKVHQQLIIDVFSNYDKTTNKRLFDLAICKDIHTFLQQLYVWGNKIDVNIKIIGLSAVEEFLYLLEDRMNVPQIQWFKGNELLGYEVISYITEDELREKQLDAYRRNKERTGMKVNVLPVGMLSRKKKKESNEFKLIL